MAQTLARHGTEAGYKAETGTGNICDRCRKAHNVYNKQYTANGKKLGLKYTIHDVLDDKYKKGKDGPIRRVGGVPKVDTYVNLAQNAREAAASDDTGQDELGPYSVSAERRGPTLTDRIKGLVMPEDAGYVPTDNAPDYLHPIDPDPDPADSDWSEVSDAEFVINAAGMRKIEENLGTYLSVVGITVEMIDPYCGGIAAENFDNMVSKWSRVISHYPAAAKLFLDSKGGTVFAWIGAIQATWPVLYAIYEHHFAKTVRTQNGRVYRQNQGAPNVDATMPPMDNYEYSAA